MNPLRKARASGEEGLSLIELMIAVFILAVSILALAGVATQSISRVRVARDQQSAADLVSAQLEAARGIDFASLALDSADPSIPATYDGDPVVEEPGGPLVHRETVAHGNRTYAITRYVTLPPPDVDQDPLKRVVVEVAWSDGDTARELVNSTLVADADRGLPVPQFDLEPPNAVIAFEGGSGYDIANDPANGAQECTQHTITNLGLTDRYAWRLENRNNSSAVSATAGASQSLYTDASRKWSARAWLQPATGTPDVSLGSPYLMKDTVAEGAGVVWMESTWPIESKGAAWMTVCYWSTDNDDGAELANEQQYFVRVRSQFDPSVVETSIHTVTVGADAVTLFLHELDKNHTGGWATSGHSRKVQGDNYPPMFMDTVAATDDIIHDMDTTLDGTGTPGLQLRHDVPASAAVWDYTLPASRPLTTGSFTIHAAAPGTDGQTATLTYQLQRVSADGATVHETYVSGTVQLEVAGSAGSAAVFTPVGASWTFASGASIASGEVLRLIVACEDETAASTDCHVDFDTTSRAGSLVVTR